MMNSAQTPFWKNKTLAEMTDEEWESVCDKCGACCLEKLEDKTTGEIEYTSIACEFLDVTTCQCKVYEDRYKVNTDCIRLTPDKVSEILWLPETCAYRLLNEGQDLPWWHPLVSGDPNTIHKAGISVRYRAVPIQDVLPKDLPDFLI